MKYVTVHQHHYQPPREDAHTGRIKRQPSAAPFPNWNARIDAECYAPNGRARIVDSDGRLVGIMNNYEFASFNVGPTLLTWLADHSPDTLSAIVEGDRLSAERLNGHGNAIAQVFNHVIMPLAHDRDKETQVVWGIEAFRFFFGRTPEGMHLAETAVDTDTLEVLARHGIKFTVLAPRQAKRFRPRGAGEWQTGGIDPSRAYLCNLPSGRSINLLFYDGPVSQAVAFEKLLASGEKFLGRLMSGFNDERKHEQLMHIAVDGETFGHHHRFGEMCLAWVVDQLARKEGFQVVSYGRYLELNPPAWEAEVHDRSSWSCEHGVERWQSNCGCKAGLGDEGWTQKWRKPLRDSLNHLRAEIDSLFDREGRKFFRDPWAARDGYIQVLLDQANTGSWLKKHALESVYGKVMEESGAGSGKMGPAAIRMSSTFQRVVALMEMQRFAMYMFTSCAWFFDDLAGIEPVQNLRYAARAMEFAGQFTDDNLEERFVNELAEAPCNLPQFKDGRGVWEQLVKPDAVQGELNLLLTGALDNEHLVRRLGELVDAARQLGVSFDEGKAQSHLLDVYASVTERGQMTGELKAAYEALADKLKVARTLLGWNRSGCVRSRRRDGWRIPQLMAKWSKNRKRSCTVA